MSSVPVSSCCSHTLCCKRGRCSTVAPSRQVSAVAFSQSHHSTLAARHIASSAESRWTNPRHPSGGATLALRQACLRHTTTPLRDQARCPAVPMSKSSVRCSHRRGLFTCELRKGAQKYPSAVPTRCPGPWEQQIRTRGTVAARSSKGTQEPCTTEEVSWNLGTPLEAAEGGMVGPAPEASSEMNETMLVASNSECISTDTKCTTLGSEDGDTAGDAGLVGQVQGQQNSMDAAVGSENLVKAETDFFMFTGYLAKYMLVMLTSGAALETFAELAGGGPSKGSVLWFCFLAGVFLGCMVGAGRVLEGYATCGPRNVVVTGSTRGLGKALAREFLMSGDNVVITSRSEGAVRSAVLELRENMAALGRRVPMAALWVTQQGPGKGEGPGNRIREYLDEGTLGVPTKGAVDWSSQRILGIACDVQDTEDVRALASLAKREFGEVNLWINNAGANSGFKPFMESTADELKQVVGTNLVGSMLCTKEAFNLFKSQARGGHIFNMEGAGSEGGATPRYAAYGSTKSALRQFHASLVQELKGSGIGIHTASPGMVLTDLLLTGSTLENKQAFNIVCEQPETVARALVPRMRSVRGTGRAVNYLTPPRIILAVITAWVRRGRWFDEEGRAVYEAEADRLRALAQGQQRQSSLLAMVEVMPSTAWVSLFTSSAIGVYLFFTSVGEWVG